MNTKVKEIIIKTKKRLFGANLGNNVSIFQGNGLDFSEIKEYSYGDDVKKINWKVTAKEQKPYINVFNEERELNIVVAFMVSGDIYFGSFRQKQELMAEIATIVGYSAVKNSDRFSTIFFSDRVEKIFEPSKSLNSVYSMLEYALDLDALGKEADYGYMSEYLLQTLKQKSIIFVVGDFYQELDLAFLAAKHEVYLINVRDRFEENPILDSDISLIDPKTLEVSELSLDSKVLQKFKSELDLRENRLQEHAVKNRISYLKLYTNEDSYIRLSSLFRGKR
jgi:uncharacterized protein (DUF58 family)